MSFVRGRYIQGWVGSGWGVGGEWVGSGWGVGEEWVGSVQRSGVGSGWGVGRE